MFALATCMTVGSSVGSWRFTLRALCGPMPILATYVAAPMEHCCSSKLHWCVIPVGLLNWNRNGYGSFTITFVILMNIGKHQSNLFSHLPGWLQIKRFLGMYPGLNIGRQAIDKPKQGLCINHVSALGIRLRKSHNILSETTLLCRLSQGLPCFKCVVHWLKVAEQHSLQITPTRHITLHLIPSVSLPLK